MLLVVVDRHVVLADKRCASLGSFSEQVSGADGGCCALGDTGHGVHTLETHPSPNLETGLAGTVADGADDVAGTTLCTGREYVWRDELSETLTVYGWISQREHEVVSRLESGTGRGTGVITATTLDAGGCVEK